MRTLVHGLALVLASAFVPVATEAQDCGSLVFGCGGGGGTSGAHTNNTGTNAYWKYPHSDCLLCAVPMAECHPYCEPQEEDAAAYAELMSAAQVGDVARVVSLGRNLAQYVRYNPERRSIQILSACSTPTIIANLRIRDFGVLVAASSLRRTNEPVSRFASVTTLW